MRKTKTVYSFNDEGIFRGTDIAWESWDLNGVFLLPANSTEIAPPEFSEKQFAFWNGSEWELKKIPEPAPEPAPETEPLTWEQIRYQRNYLLSETDWIFAPDVNVSNMQTWLDYRKTLRDVPQTFASPEEVIWPEKP